MLFGKVALALTLVSTALFAAPSPANAADYVVAMPMISIVDLGTGGGSQNYGGDPSNCGWIGGKYLNCP